MEETNFCGFCSNFYIETIYGSGFCSIDDGITYCGREACKNFKKK
jgi:hypothetical protein